MDKKFLFAIGLSIATVWGLNYYMGKKAAPEQPGVAVIGQQQAAPVAGQPVRVPTSQEMYKPLGLEVDFAEKKLTAPEELVSIQTQYYSASLSTYGAILSSLDFKEHTGRTGAPLRTVHSKGSFEDEQRKKGCFLLALDKNTPFLYTVAEKQETPKTVDVVFKAELDQWTVFKKFSFHKDSYQIDLSLRFEPKTKDAFSFTPRIFFTAPFVGESTEDPSTMLVFNEAKQTIEKPDVAAAQGLAWFWVSKKPIFGAEDRYFVHTLFNDPSKFVQRAYVKQIDTKNVLPILEGPLLAAAKNEWTLSFYMGPKLFDQLSYVDDRLDDVMSFGWLSWLCKLLLKLLSWLNDLIGNFGWAIIVMTILLKLPFTPLSIYSRKQMEVYQRYLPSINKIRTKYRQDMKMQHEELMKFYKDHNIAPTTHFVGCLPLLIQMPILFALYRVLNNYLDLYQAPFIGWIHDLSAKDPYYVLPVLMGLSMLWQQKMTPTSDEKQRVIMIFMSIFMTVVFASFPAGLVLYWLVNNLLSVGEDYVRKYFFS